VTAAIASAPATIRKDFFMLNSWFRSRVVRGVSRVRSGWNGVNLSMIPVLQAAAAGAAL
jgi:hypothetical protein